MKARDVLREDQLVSFIAELYNGDLHAKRVLSLALRYARSPHQCIVGRTCDWPRVGPHPWNPEQTRCQAGRPATQ